MAIGNLKDQGNQGKNTPFQLRDLQLQGQILKAILGIVFPAGGATEATQLQVLDNVTSKINRIQGSADYSRTFTYDLVGTQNVLTITHTGTTLIGAETIVETFTYVNPAINGSNVVAITYS